MATKKLSLLRRIGIGAAMFAGIAGTNLNANAQTSKPVEQDSVSFKLPNLNEARVRNETWVQEQGTSWFKSYYSLADGDKEYLKAVNYSGKKNGKACDWTAVGVRIPEFKIGSLKNTGTIFGVVADEDLNKRGIGFETQHTLNDLTLLLNAERAYSNGEDPTRLGIGLDWRVNKDWAVGIGFDKHNTAKGAANNYFGKVVYKPTSKDEVGLGVIISELNSEQIKTLAGYWLHQGKGTWGTRNYARYDNLPNGKETLFFQSIIAQDCYKLGPKAGDFLVGRGSEENLGPVVVENAFLPETAPAPNRTSKGFFSLISGNLIEDNGSQSGDVRLQAGYKIPIVNGLNVSPYGIYSQAFKEGSARTQRAGAGILVNVNVLGVPLTLDANVSDSTSHGSNPDAFFGMQYIVKW